MNPDTVKKLTEDVGEFKELITYLASEAQKLNTLDGVEKTGVSVEVEVLARLRAYETLQRILAPLVNFQDLSTGVVLNDYVA